MFRLPASLVFLFFCCSPIFCSQTAAQTYLVLPFFNRSGSSNLDWIGESIGESIRDTLASEGVLVVDRDDRIEVYRRLSIRQYAVLTRASVIQISESLDADYVIYGDFDVSKPPEGQAATKGALQITAEVLDIKRLRKGPKFVESGALEDLASLQSHLSWQALRFVLPKNAPTEDEFRQRRKPVRLDAIENYVRGLLATTNQQKHRFFTQAALLDPEYSAPCFQVGRLQFQSKNYRSAIDWLQRVPEGDPNYREATFFLGLARYYSGDFEGAERAFQQVAETVPLNEVLNNLGVTQSRRNQEAALENLKRALEGDEADPVYHFNVGYVLWKRGQFDEAAERFRAVLERNAEDEDAEQLLARCLKRSGPRPGDPQSDGLERLKDTYYETAWWQLKAMLQKSR
jgi:Flp pilus assembly protein TadD, contains TPR repeats